MSPRHLALVVAAVAVLAAGVYLFIEVRATPAQAQVASVTPTPAPAHEAQSPELKSPAPVPAAGGTRAPVQARPPADDPRPAVPEDEPVGPVEGPRLGASPNKLDMIMDQANKAYDREEFEEARAIAGKVLAKSPNNVRMLRIMVSSSCIQGDNITAQKYYDLLPVGDRAQMKARCDRYGVTFRDP